MILKKEESKTGERNYIKRKKAKIKKTRKNEIKIRETGEMNTVERREGRKMKWKEKERMNKWR